MSWAFCRRFTTLPCQTNTSCLVALFNCDIDSTQVPKQSSLHFVSQSSSVTPNSSAMPPSSHAFPDSCSLEAVVKTIHVSLVTVNHVVFQHASCASTWVFEFVVFAGMRGHASLTPFVVGREYGDICYLRCRFFTSSVRSFLSAS